MSVAIIVGQAGRDFAPEDLESMEAVERMYITMVCDRVKGNMSKAARILGFDRRTLYRKLASYGAIPASYRVEHTGSEPHANALTAQLDSERGA